MNNHEKKKVENMISTARAQERVECIREYSQSFDNAHAAGIQKGMQKGLLIGGAIATIFYLLLCAAYMVARAWGIIQII